MKSCTSPKTRSAVAYFYFDFNDPEKQKLQNCLSSLIAQLCGLALAIPEKLKSMYNRCGRGNQTPSLNDLKDIMSYFATASEFNDIFLILDALDECPKDGNEDSRSELLEWIQEISNQLSFSVRLLVTSRPEPDIGKILCPPAFRSVSIQGSQVKSDISRYIQSQLSGFPISMKPAIEKTLTDKADGM